uniref:hypothetical protein n=1 Tax=Paractinoplanes polyasparticus TaxID=2856853 RepID=UPI001C841F96|nr:hypothetical protein [Actinoplanes polyasparticus]
MRRRQALLRRTEYCRLPIPSPHQQRKITVEAIVGGITGVIEDPRTLLLGRRLRYIARTVPLALSQRQEIARLLTA